MHPAPDLDPIPFDPVPTASSRHDGWRARAGAESFRAARDVAVDQAVAAPTRRLRWFGAIGRWQSIADSVTFV